LGHRHELEAGRIEGSLVARQVGALSRFTMTDLLALRLMDEAAGADLPAGGQAFADRGGEVVALAEDLRTFVGHLVDGLLTQYGVTATKDTVEVRRCSESHLTWRCFGQILGASSDWRVSQSDRAAGPRYGEERGAGQSRRECLGVHGEQSQGAGAAAIPTRSMEKPGTP
jgi:hypothetical protein